MATKKRKKTQKKSKQNLVQAHNLHIAVTSIVMLVGVVFLPLFVDPLFNGVPYSTTKHYVTLSTLLIGVFAAFAIYSGLHGFRHATHHLHWSVYVTALTIGIMALIQFLWLGLPAVLS